jgi:hypothetical protein
MADQQLLEQIKAVHKKSQGRYGSPRIYQALLKLRFVAVANEWHG